jgi:hypothetical protein
MHIRAGDLSGGEMFLVSSMITEVSLNVLLAVMPQCYFGRILGMTMVCSVINSPVFSPLLEMKM